MGSNKSFRIHIKDKMIKGTKSRVIQKGNIVCCFSEPNVKQESTKKNGIGMMIGVD